ncbi:MAG TPA: hypothetical protein VF896_01980 [Anaerolineales bacterium]
MGEPQGFDRNGFLHRIGTFFLLVGIGLLVFFLLSDAAKQVTFSYFCWSTIFLIVGFVFRGQLKRAAKPSGRFSLVKRLTPKSKQDPGKK